MTGPALGAAVVRTRAVAALTPVRGEIWWAESDDMRRPVMVVTRDAAIPVLGAILVAPVTRTVRGIPTEIPLGSRRGPAPALRRLIRQPASGAQGLADSPHGRPSGLAAMRYVARSQL